MKPTAKLRFLERELTFPTGTITIPDGFPVVGRQTFRVLQQWWEVDDLTDAVRNKIVDGEWRDIPLEKEQE
jgi:hypothetical protein